mgnify:CR=1 FL=1
MATTNTLFYYKGTAFPIILEDENVAETMMDTAKEMITLGVRNNISLNQQKKDYKEQLDLIEGKIFEIIGNKSISNKEELYKYLEIIAEHFGESIPSLQSLWTLDICALLKLKVIENDNMNGILKYKTLGI